MSPADGSTTSGEAFAELGNEVRLRVLRVLSDALCEGDGPLSFSELRDRVGYEDDGNFGYHLDRLRGSFIRKTEHGYVLRARGLAVVGTVLAGTLTEGEHQATTIGGNCLFCGGTLLAEYSTGQLVVRCSHGHLVLSNIYPSDGAGHGDLNQLVSVVETMTAQQLKLAREGVCSNCYGEMRSVIEAGEVMDHRFRAACTRCGMQYTTTVGMAFTSHPTVVSFYDRHDRDLTDEHFWELEISRPEAVSRRKGDPPRYGIEIILEDESAELVLDSTAHVVRSTVST